MGSITSALKSLLRQKNSWWLSLSLWMLFCASVEATELRVAIKKKVNQIQVGSTTTAIVKDASGQVVGEIAGMNAFSAQPERGVISLDKWRSGQLLLEPTEAGYVWIGDRWYRGKVRLVRDGAGVTAVNYVDLEAYLYSVVGSEAYPNWPLEALKAQAVAARSYALHQSSQSSSHLYDLDTTTKTQVYKGLDGEYTSTLEAVEATKGQVLTYNNQVILAAFHSSSGGHTENVEDVWSSPLPYLRGVVDYDQESPVFNWSKTFSADQLTRHIGGIGTITGMIPVKTTPRGRVVKMKIVGDRGTKEISGAKLRQVLDLRSTLFTVNQIDDNFQISGRGFGHGIGLSQWGTYYLSEQGIDYQNILAHYYQQARLSNVE